MLSVDDQRNLSFQQRAGLFARMTQLLAGAGTGLISFQQHAQRALCTAIVDKLQRNPLTANLQQVAGADNDLRFRIRFGFREEL